MDLLDILYNLSVDAHLNCFRLEATVNNAFINICAQVLFGCIFPFLLGIYLGLELMTHMVTLYLVFGELPNYFTKWLHHFTVPLTRYEGSNFTSLPTFIRPLIIVSLVCVKWYYIGFLICIY